MNEQEWLSSSDPAAMLALRRTPCCGCWWTDNGDGTVSLAAGSTPCGRCDNGPIMPVSPFGGRKLRLFAVAVSRLYGRHARRNPDVAAEHAETAARAERWADEGSPGVVRVSDVAWWMMDDDAARGAANLCDSLAPGKRAPTAALLRCVFGNPFRPVAFRVTQPDRWVCVGCGLAERHPPHEGFQECGRCGRWEWRQTDERDDLLTPTVLSLAQVASDERLPDATLDPARLAVLSDALEEAGCADGPLLRHLRGWDLKPNHWDCDPRNDDCYARRRTPCVRGCHAIDLLLGKE